MTTLEEVKHMQRQEIPEEKIIQTLRERGIPYREIADALSQSRIKAAVEQPNLEPEYAGTSVPEGMQPSIMNQTEQNPLPMQTPDAMAYETEQPQQTYPEAPSPGGYSTQQPQEYTPPYNEYAQQYQYQYEQPTASSDVITEISEQGVAEKLSEIRKHLEKIIDMKTTFESRVESLDERIKKIERIIDTLQSSVLRKVGDYVTNIQDIKSELIETQKTFAKLLPEIKKPAEHHKEHKK